MKEALFEALPAVNTYLEKKTFVLPSDLLSDSIGISTPSLIIHSGFLELGFTPTFTKAAGVSTFAAPFHDYSKYSEELRIDKAGTVTYNTKMETKFL